jgi:hypothetical protein
MEYQMNKTNNENKILLMLAFFSISIGLWNNFRQLWLQDNGFTVTNISNILSIGTFISVIAIAFIGKYIKLDKLKKTISIVLIIKFINMLVLYYLNQTNLINYIYISIVIDIITEYIIITSIYPLITIIQKKWDIIQQKKINRILI